MPQLCRPFFVILLLISTSFKVQAVPSENPYRLMNWVAEQAFSRLAEVDRSSDDQQQQLEAIVLEQLMPHIDYRYAAFSVLGKNIKQTTAPQRERFAEAFKDYLVEIYVHALHQYKQQQVRVEPEKPLQGKTKVTVKAQLLEEGRPPINLHFKFRKLKNEERWLAYDLIAEGVSLLSTKRSEFDNLLRNQGIDEVTKLLEQRQLKAEGEYDAP